MEIQLDKLSLTVDESALAMIRQYLPWFGFSKNALEPSHSALLEIPTDSELPLITWVKDGQKQKLGFDLKTIHEPF